MYVSCEVPLVGEAMHPSQRWDGDILGLGTVKPSPALQDAKTLGWSRNTLQDQNLGTPRKSACVRRLRDTPERLVPLCFHPQEAPTSMEDCRGFVTLEQRRHASIHSPSLLTGGCPLFPEELDRGSVPLTVLTKRPNRVALSVHTLWIDMWTDNSWVEVPGGPTQWELCSRHPPGQLTQKSSFSTVASEM